MSTYDPLSHRDIAEVCRTPLDNFYLQRKARSRHRTLPDLSMTVRVLVEHEANHRFFALLLAVLTVIDLGIYRNKGPRKVYVVWGAGHFEADWHRIEVILAMPDLDTARSVIERNTSIYLRDHEKDSPGGWVTEWLQYVINKSLVNT